MNEATEFGNIGACVFDAYGTLFDFAAAARRCRDDLGDNADRLSEIWRTKQLHYTWLRSLMNQHGDFWQVTGDALDYAMASLGLDNAGLRERLMELYLELDTYPEVKETLTRLRVGGMRTAILSNGSPRMLESAVANAGIADLLDAVMSVEEVGIFKPHPSVYQLAVDRLGLEAGRIAYQSSNAWDAAAAATFGFRVVWINRFGQTRERLPDSPHAEVPALDDLPALVGIT